MLQYCFPENYFNLVLHVLCDFGVVGMPIIEDMGLLSGVGTNFLDFPIYSHIEAENTKSLITFV